MVCLKYIQKNWLFLLVMLAGSLALCLQMRQVVLYADDYSIGIHSAGGIAEAFEHTTNNYMTWGGGYTAFLVIILFGMGEFIWKTVLISMLVLFVGLTVKMVCHKHQQYKWLVALILWAFIFVLSIWVSSEVFYWLDGAMAYLFSMFESFLLFYFLYTRLFQGISKKYDKFFLPIIALFAGWNSAQGGLIAVILSLVLILWKRFIRKEPIKKLYYISGIVCLVGFLIFFFAPGNSARMDSFTNYVNLNIFEKVLYRARGVTSIIFSNTIVEFTAAPLFIYLLIGLIAITDLKFAVKEKSKKIKTLRYVCIVYSLLFLLGFTISCMAIPEVSGFLKHFYNYIDLFSTNWSSFSTYLGLLSYLAMILVIFTSLTSAFFISKHNDNPFLFTTVLVAYAAEFCMVMAPYSPLRTTLYTIAFSWIAISYLLVISRKNSISILGVALVIFTIIDVNLGLAIIICDLFLRHILNKPNSIRVAEFYLFITFLTLLSMLNYGKTLYNYYQNRLVNEENIARILEVKKVYDETGKTPEIVYLKKPYNSTYGFTGLAGVDWVEHSINNFYGLPTTLNLEYEGEAQ